jgi:hypothetical protein
MENNYKDKTIHAEGAGIHRSISRKALRTICIRRRFLSLENISGFALRLRQRQLFTPLKQRVEYIPKYVLV